jgi:AmiR/NasT family two-component response regulator
VRSVLICNGEPNIRTSIKNKLNELGFCTIFECSNGKSAVTMACESLPDIAILDVPLPEMGGLNAAREIRQKLKIPVILFMSSYDPDTLSQASKIGITTTLSKPFRGQDLLPAIELAFAHAEEMERLKADVKDLQKTIDNQEIIYKAKKVLMRSGGLSESEAFRKIQKLAMDKKKCMRQIAETILVTDKVL